MHPFFPALTLAGLLAAAGALLQAPVGAQVPEFDFYAAFRQWRMSLAGPVRVDVDEVLRQYRAKLVAEGVAPGEIERRATLIRTRRDDLEADFWNRYFTTPDPGFNTAPNAFLVSVAEKRPPGRALDVGMGEGRNTLYLAKAGWDVTGFDPAAKAVALAQERAAKLGIKMKTLVARDTDFDFGSEQWDLILYSWVAPRPSAKQAIEGLKPGGIIVIEIGSTLLPRRDLLPELFKPLRIVQNTEERAKSDFFNRQEMDVIRFVAEKPRK